MYKRAEPEAAAGMEPSQDAKEVDNELFIRKVFERDPEKGCELLFRRYYTNLCNHSVRFVHSKAVAEDIVGETFAIFWQKKIYEQISVSYRSYLYKAVRHRSYNHLKMLSEKNDPLEQVYHASSDDQLPDEILHYTELHQKIERIIQQLPPQTRRAYLLKRVEGKKYDEIAREMKVSNKAVEALVSRALARLRQGLRDEWLFFALIGILSQVQKSSDVKQLFYL
ncbi:RNA polymerase sigma-70 factor [Ravibacter arvi]|uniref:RNA polymerase sigma-70 factor n=2 Tax=Ravibacter arvi TaxID=2051041 RepID=A0ABP8M5X0_9BACT